MPKIFGWHPKFVDHGVLKVARRLKIDSRYQQRRGQHLAPLQPPWWGTIEVCQYGLANCHRGRKGEEPVQTLPRQATEFEHGCQPNVKSASSHEWKISKTNNRITLDFTQIVSIERKGGRLIWLTNKWGQYQPNKLKLIARRPILLAHLTPRPAPQRKYERMKVLNSCLMEDNSSKKFSQFQTILVNRNEITNALSVSNKIQNTIQDHVVIN